MPSVHERRREVIMERMHQPAPHRHTGGSIITSAGSERTACHVQVARLLREQGLRAALAYLNARTRYRFTGLYRADPPFLRNIGLFDRENPTIDVSGAVTNLEETYCSITTSTAAPYAVEDALNDEGLVTHAARDSVLCYAGVPIRLASGVPWGTLCHFDLRPRLLERVELAVLSTVAPVVTEWLARNRGGEPG